MVAVLAAIASRDSALLESSLFNNLTPCRILLALASPERRSLSDHNRSVTFLFFLARVTQTNVQPKSVISCSEASKSRFSIIKNPVKTSDRPSSNAGMMVTDFFDKKCKNRDVADENRNNDEVTCFFLRMLFMFRTVPDFSL